MDSFSRSLRVTTLAQLLLSQGLRQLWWLRAGDFKNIENRAVPTPSTFVARSGWKSSCYSRPRPWDIKFLEGKGRIVDGNCFLPKEPNESGERELKKDLLHPELIWSHPMLKAFPTQSGHFDFAATRFSVDSRNKARRRRNSARYRSISSWCCTEPSDFLLLACMGRSKLAHIG